MTQHPSPSVAKLAGNDWHACDWCRKYATRYSIPMLGQGPDWNGAIPRLWVCHHCRPEVDARFDRYLNGPTPTPDKRKKSK